MAWTAPRTWVTSEVVTASIMNTHVRDNFLETAPAKATTANGIILSGTSVNSIVTRVPGVDFVSASESTTSTSYTDLSTSGPSISMTTGTRALVGVGAYMSSNTAGSSALMSWAVSGATTLSATDDRAARKESGVANDPTTVMWVYRYTLLTAGSNTFTAKYRADANTASFDDRHMWVLPF